MSFKITVLIIALLGNLYSVLLDIVRLRSANNPTPANVADVYDAETYQKWKRYNAEHNKLNIVCGIVSCLVTLCLLVSDAYAAFATLFPNTEFWQLFAVVLLLLISDDVVELMKNYIAIMIIEQKYGFNRSTVKTFVFDSIRSVLFGLLISVGLASLIRSLYLLMGNWFIVAFAGVMFLITMLTTFLYPFFSRIGNKFTPLEDGELKTRLMSLLEKNGYRVKAIEVMDASRRTTKLNAYITGLGKMKTIVLFDNLLNVMSDDEICAIFAHEMGHGIHKDVLKRQILNIGQMLLMGAMIWVAVNEPRLCTGFGFDGINYGFVFLLIGIGLSVLQPLMGLLINANSRAAEYRADRQAVLEGYGEAMITAFKKLAKDNFSHLAPSRVNVLLEYSHPPIDRRVEAVEQAMAKLEK